MATRDAIFPRNYNASHPDYFSSGVPGFSSNGSYTTVYSEEETNRRRDAAIGRTDEKTDDILRIVKGIRFRLTLLIFISLPCVILVGAAALKAAVN